MTRKGIKIYYNHPVPNSSLGNDLKVLEEMETSTYDFDNLCTNCFEFLDSKYLLDKTVNFIQVIYDGEDHWLQFQLKENDDMKVSCYLNGKLFYPNIRPVHNIRKMLFGGMFDVTNKSNIVSGDE